MEAEPKIVQSGPGSNSFQIEARYVMSVKDVYEAFGVSGSIDLKMAFFSGSANMSLANKVKLRQDKEHLILSATQIFSNETYDDVEFNPEALQKFETIDQLIQQVGEEIVVHEKRSAELYVIFSRTKQENTRDFSTKAGSSADIAGKAAISTAIDFVTTSNNQSTDVQAEVISVGLGTLADSGDIIEVILGSKGLSEGLTSFINQQFRHCSREAARPHCFTTVPTKTFLYASHLNRANSQSSPSLEVKINLTDLFFMGADYKRIAEECFELASSRSTEHPLRKVYFQRMGKLYQSYEANVRENGKDSLEGKECGAIEEPSEKVRYDWCPHIAEYDEIAKSDYFRWHYRGIENRDPFFEEKKSCLIPVMERNQNNGIIRLEYRKP
jgi:hypothetical protein